MTTWFKMIIPVCFALYIPPKHSLIDWKPDYKLQWEDFRETPPRNAPNAALTSTTVTFDFSYNEKTLVYHVHCQFDKNLSWGKVKTDYILSHEQGHFDITEIHARKLNRLLQTYNVGEISRVSNDINKLYEKTMQELNEMQAKYDSETNNSINQAKQAEWLIKISKTLKELEQYADYNK